MKIKYGVGIILLCLASYFVAQRIYSADKIQSTPVETKPVPVKILTSLELPACKEFLSSGDADPNGHDVGKQIEKCSYHLLETGDFASLESTMSYLKKNKARSPSGYWLQTNFYVGLEKFLGSANDEASFDEMETTLKRWIQSIPDSDTARLELSHSMMGRAAFYRGSGYADSVTNENFEKYYTQVSKTKKFLLENEGISKRDPEWFFQMLNIANVERNADEKEHQKRFEQAIKLYPDYYPIYFSAAQFYLAKWHGGAGSFEQFARDATSALEPEQAKAVYARMYRNQICSRCGARDVTHWRDHWSDIQAGMDQVIKDFPDQWNINTYARMACAAYEQDKTLELMQKIQGEPVADAWDDEQFTYDYCASWSNLTGERK